MSCNNPDCPRCYTSGRAMLPDEPARNIVEQALRRHAELYRNNSWFKLSVDTLIPLMIDALALKAEQDWEKHERMVKAIMECTGPHNLVVPEGFVDESDFDLSTGQPK